MKLTRGRIVFNIFNYFYLTIAGVAALFPLLYVFSVSLTPFTELVKNGGFVIIPKHATFEAYKELFGNEMIPRAFMNSVFITTTATILGLSLTILLAYGLAKKSLPGRNVIIFICFFTMIFQGGLIPQYMLVKSLGLLNTYGALIFHGTVSIFNLLVMKSFFEELPLELEEAAMIDGASELKILYKIIIPLSMPAIATIGLFYAVYHWNTFFEAILYISDVQKHPLQAVLQTMLNVPDASEVGVDISNMVPTEALKMAAVMITVVPILMIYPFLQKHFTSGVLLGSVKG